MLTVSFKLQLLMTNIQTNFCVYICSVWVCEIDFVLPEKNQEADAEEEPTLHAVEMSCIPLLMEPACSSSEVQGATKMRDNDAASRFLVGA